MRIKSLRRIRNFNKKTVFLRVDFNVPMKGKKILDDYKIKASLDTINFLRKKGAKIIIASHLASPHGIHDKEYSLRPLAKHLENILNLSLKFLPDILSPKAKEAIQKMKSGDIVVLENLRFYQEEYDNNKKFASYLASLADFYINEAFAVSHRNQASVSAIKNFLPAYAGLLLEQELRALDRVLKPKKPLVLVMGGAKTETKVPLILKLYSRSSHILLGGALANTLFKFQGLEIGKSLADTDKKIIKKFFVNKKILSKIILPVDLVLQTRSGKVKISGIRDVRPSDKILDIGPATISNFATYIKKAKTLVWNGPMGKFEEKTFKHGTVSIALLIAARSSGRAYGVVGGGETLEALKLTKMTKYIDWISTGGGALLSYLGGKKMPGLEKIICK